MLIETFTAGDYRAEVYDTNMVKVYKADILIDNPGPWGDIDGAKLWAQTIVGHYATQPEEPAE